ncbi:DUF4905 domain-containing protein [Anseongella ginsenosidimutans]|nr:DUF4905 domain-containing protein [Anseongella ginsenosidimutans]
MDFFQLYPYHGGTWTFDELQLQEPWFCGLEGLAHGHAYLHGYLSETLPEHRGIFAVRLENGQIAWEDYNLVFSHATGEGLIAWNYKSEPRRYQLVDPQTGTTVRSFASREESEQLSSPISAAAVYLPSKVTLDEEWLRHLPPDALPAADLLQFNQRWLLAFYTADEGEETASLTENKKMDHHLYVINNERQVIHKDLLGEGILQPAMDTFFVMGNQLYYIKSKSEILAYFL